MHCACRQPAYILHSLRASYKGSIARGPTGLAPRFMMEKALAYCTVLLSVIVPYSEY